MLRSERRECVPYLKIYIVFLALLSYVSKSVLYIEKQGSFHVLFQSYILPLQLRSDALAVLTLFSFIFSKLYEEMVHLGCTVRNLRREGLIVLMNLTGGFAFSKRTQFSFRCSVSIHVICVFLLEYNHCFGCKSSLYIYCKIQCSSSRIMNFI